MGNELLGLAKRLADYVRLTIETGGLKPESPIGIAYRDFIEEWDKYRPLSKATSDVATKPKSTGGISRRSDGLSAKWPARPLTYLK